MKFKDLPEDCKEELINCELFNLNIVTEETVMHTISNLILQEPYTVLITKEDDIKVIRSCDLKEKISNNRYKYTLDSQIIYKEHTGGRNVNML